MATVKTAISIPADLLKQVDRYAKRRRIPRSQVFAEGARRLLRDVTDADITRRVNAALDDDQTDDRALARAASASLAQFLEREGDR